MRDWCLDQAYVVAAGSKLSLSGATHDKGTISSGGADHREGSWGGAVCFFSLLLSRLLGVS